MKNVVALDRPFDDPLPATPARSTSITFFFFYHDTTYMMVDRAAMNKKLFEALKPGGMMIVADHRRRRARAPPTARRYRIEQTTLEKEVVAAGFEMIAAGKFLRHPEDPREEKIFGAKTADRRVRAEIPEAELMQRRDFGSSYTACDISLPRRI